MDPLTRRALFRALGAFVGVLVIGSIGIAAIGTLRDKGAVHLGGPSPTPTATASASPREDTWLAWVPGGLPEGFGTGLGNVHAVAEVAVQTADIAWLVGSLDADGVPADTPADPYMIPIDTVGIEPAYATFLPQPERSLVAELRPGEAILSETAAEMRGLGEGATMTFAGGQSVRIVGTLPDHLMGAYELLVPRPTGETIGVTHERYVVFHTRPDASSDPARLAAFFLPYVPTDYPYGEVEVRAPGQTPYVRANDRELPPMYLKARFGEFAAYPDASTPGSLVIDPTWVESHIVSQTLPVFGTVTCHAKTLKYLMSVADRLAASAQADPITGVGDCYAPEAAPDDPSGPFTGRPFGAVIDLNPGQNRPGDEPQQDTAVVRLMYRAGFGWGGRDAYQQGARFRYVHPPQKAD